MEYNRCEEKEGVTVKKMESFIGFIAEGQTVADLKATVANRSEYASIYPDSIHQVDQTVLFMMKGEHVKKLCIVGDSSPIFSEIAGEIVNTIPGPKVKVADLSVENSKVIRKYFDFANPKAMSGAAATIGLGDRLGLASPGHIRLIKQTKMHPILAQQSIRELNLTGRNYAGVMADAVWAVFQEDYRGGFGADGDHLKTPAEVGMALDNGYTMITLDCSEHINNVSVNDKTAIDQILAKIDPAQIKKLEQTFLGHEIKLQTGLALAFTPEKLKLNIAVYQQAVNFAIQIYSEFLKPLAGKVDFEVSIDETMTPTDPASHYFVAEQLTAAAVKINSMAPRFCGEFQKGIDYIGDLKQFAREYGEHDKIARHYGYKLSIHSGSDKFSVFPTLGKVREGYIHVKTAGTNWLEAVRVIIRTDPALYREMHKFALENLMEAKKYYHITADMNRVPNIDTLSDAQLADLMNQNDARQLIHIAYGLILTAKDKAGNSRFRDRIYSCLYQNEELYYEMLQNHIGKHIKLLGLM